MVSTALHHNRHVWGADHDRFDPDRFYPGTAAYNGAYAGYLLHFGQGNRQCIGRNIAMMSIWKIVITLLKKYDFKAEDDDDVLELLHTGAADKKGPLLARVSRRDGNS